MGNFLILKEGGTGTTNIWGSLLNVELVHDVKSVERVLCDHLLDATTPDLSISLPTPVIAVNITEELLNLEKS